MILSAIPTKGFALALTKQLSKTTLTSSAFIRLPFPGNSLYR
jgi:hypothetical protein